MPEHQSSNAKRELTETNIVPGPPWHKFDLSLWRVLEGTGGLVSFCPPSGVFGHHCDPFGALFVAYLCFVAHLSKTSGQQGRSEAYCPRVFLVGNMQKSGFADFLHISRAAYLLHICYIIFTCALHISYIF